MRWNQSTRVQHTGASADGGGRAQRDALCGRVGKARGLVPWPGPRGIAAAGVMTRDARTDKEAQ